MRHLDLFSGIGGFALAARWIGWGTVGFCDNEAYARRVIRRHWPNVPIYKDVRDITEPIGCDIITGGFPCQPFSQAGKQTGTADDRYLWPEMLRIITQERPTWVVGENVTGIIGLALDQVLADLEGQGYTARPFIIPAVAVDAPHRRDRVWIIGYADGHRQSNGPIDAKTSRLSPMANADIKGLERHSRDVVSEREPGWINKEQGRLGAQGSLSDGPEWPPEPDIPRVVNGLPYRVERIRATGNAIVPKVAYRIFSAINTISRRHESGEY